MDVSAQDIGRMARAQVIADEYARALDLFGALNAECEEEARVLRTMKRWAIAVVALFGLILIAAYVSMCIDLSASYPIPVLIVGGAVVTFLIGVIPVAWMAFIPAGFIGMWRAIKRSGWIVWGGGLFMLCLMIVFVYIPCLGGVFFYLGQMRRVKKLEARVAAAGERYTAASRALG